jgi:hypothetical protein
MIIATILWKSTIGRIEIPNLEKAVLFREFVESEKVIKSYDFTICFM